MTRELSQLICNECKSEINNLDGECSYGCKFDYTPLEDRSSGSITFKKYKVTYELLEEYLWN